MQFARLPEEVREQARNAYQLWKSNPYHHSLHFKRVSNREPVFSIRIGQGWRAVGLLEDTTIYRFWIGTHRDYDKLIKRF